MKSLPRYLAYAVIFLAAAVLVSAAVKTSRGALEASNSTSRYALIEAIVHNRTFFFTDSQARSSAPDITWYRGRYFSIFTPGVSFLALPFYHLGLALGQASLVQPVTFSVNLLALGLNFWLIIRLTRRLGADTPAGILAALVWVFATNSLTYAATLTQHQITTSLLLLALLNSLDRARTPAKNLWLGAVSGLAVLVDMPNLFFLVPALVLAAIPHFIISGSHLRIRPSLLAIGLGILPFLLLFGWYNRQLTGSFLKLGQTIGRSDYPYRPKPVSAPDNPNPTINYTRRRLPLYTRLQTHGLYLLTISNERGWFYYSPVVIIGLLGLFLSLKSPITKTGAMLALSTIAVTLVVYSMHGDPWGGWAFGSRYLIPASALAATGIGAAVSKLGRRWWFVLLFSILLVYSAAVNSAGTLTTALVPPKVEAIHFERPIPYTYAYNFRLIFRDNLTRSLIYTQYLNRFLTVPAFYLLFTSAALGTIFTSYLIAWRRPRS